jgi:hypothetical protein
MTIITHLGFQSQTRSINDYFICLFVLNLKTLSGYPNISFRKEMWQKFFAGEPQESWTIRSIPLLKLEKARRMQLQWEGRSLVWEQFLSIDHFGDQD